MPPPRLPLRGRVLLITSIFLQNRSRHSGSFSAKRAVDYVKHLDNAPMFCDERVTPDNTRTVVLTDNVRLVRQPFRRTRVVLVPFAHVGEINSYRFVHILDYIEKGDGWCTHAYMFDASDVTVFLRPSTDVDQLAVGVDIAQGWLKSLMVAQNYTPSDALRASLSNKKAIMYNSGILGGSRRRLLNVLRAFRARALAHPMVYDMIHVNEIFADDNRLLTLGYPYGPVHLPFWGTPRGCRNESCRHSFLRGTMGYYWFGHKIPSTWISIVREGVCGDPS